MNNSKDTVLQEKITPKEEYGMKVRGEVIDKIYKNGKLVQTIESHNLVVNKFLELILALLKEESGYGGIQYWAVGDGSSSWDDTLPSPTLNDTQLTSEIGRVAILASDLTFLNDDYTESATPTHILQIKHTFGTADCNGAWREFGIFGGNATASANSGVMLDRRTHALITKTSEMTVERTLRFILSLT